jgi:hypothetical protein
VKQSIRRLMLSFAASVALPAGPALAQDIGPQVPGWSELIASLQTLPSRMLATLPEAERNDPQVQLEVARLALESLASQAVDAIGGDGDHPMFLPAIGEVLNVGQPNADTIYRGARITPGGTYRLTGRRGTVRIVRIGESGPNMGEGGTGAKQVGAMKSYHDVNALHADADGRFSVILSPQRPAGYTGDWWPLDPTSTKLLLRMVSSDWSRERDPAISIERLDVPVAKARPPAAELEARLRRLPAATSAMGLLLVDHVEKLRQEGYVNKLKVFDVSQLGGLTGQFYYEGPYELADDEALIVEAKVPAGCLYRSMILTNEIYETTDWIDNESSLNDSQAKPEADGVLRVVVSAKDPGVPNWLDTAGYPKGLIQGRWTECQTQPVPTVRKVALADVRKSLPADTPTVTPQERERLVRDRRTAFLERPLW